MSFVIDNDSGFSENDINFARQTFFRDCPNGRCSKEKFLTCLRKSSLQKSFLSKIHFIKILQNYRRSKKFFSMMFDIYDQNHDGELDFNEYLYALSAITGVNRLRTIETLFRFFDINNEGYITHEKFNSRKKIAAQFLGQYKHHIKNNSFNDQAFNIMDLDHDGKISKQDFIQWHLKYDEKKIMKRRQSLLKNFSTVVDIRDRIPEQVENKNTVDNWLDTTTNLHNNQELSSIKHVDRYFVKLFHRARNHFHHEKAKIYDNQSDSDVFSASSIKNFTENDSNVNSLFDLDDDDDLQSIPTDDIDSELLCKSLEAVLMKTLYELRQHRKKLNSNQINTSVKEDQQTIITRL